MGKEEVDVNYLAVSPEKFLARENPPDDAVARYYQENEAEFRLPDRARVTYLIFRIKDYLDRVKLSPDGRGQITSKSTKPSTPGPR